MPSRAAISRFFSPSKRLIRKTSRQRSGSASTAVEKHLARAVGRLGEHLWRS
jgi:hypothetical protein